MAISQWFRPDYDSNLSRQRHDRIGFLEMTVAEADGQMNNQMDKYRYRQMDGQTDGQTDGWADAQIPPVSYRTSSPLPLQY